MRDGSTTDKKLTELSDTIDGYLCKTILVKVLREREVQFVHRVALQLV